MNRTIKNSLWLSPIHLILLFFILAAPVYFFLAEWIHVIPLTADNSQAYGWGNIFSIAASGLGAFVFALLGAICSRFGSLKWFHGFFHDNAKVFFGIFILGLVLLGILMIFE